MIKALTVCVNPGDDVQVTSMPALRHFTFNSTLWAIETITNSAPGLTHVTYANTGDGQMGSREALRTFGPQVRRFTLEECHFQGDPEDQEAYHEAFGFCTELAVFEIGLEVHDGSYCTDPQTTLDFRVLRLLAPAVKLEALRLSLTLTRMPTSGSLLDLLDAPACLELRQLEIVHTSELELPLPVSLVSLCFERGISLRWELDW